jgi:hypothetical protein
VPTGGAAGFQRVEEHVTQRRGQGTQILLDDLGGGEMQDLLCSSIDGDDALVAPDGDDAARHVRKNPLAELLLALELVVQRDVADGRGEMGAQVEKRLGLTPTVGRADDRLTDGQDGHELAVGQQRHGQNAL